MIIEYNIKLDDLTKKVLDTYKDKTIFTPDINIEADIISEPIKNTDDTFILSITNVRETLWYSGQIYRNGKLIGEAHPKDTMDLWEIPTTTGIDYRIKIT